MSTPTPGLRGVLSPVLTPFNADRSPSPARFVKHCRWLLRQGVGLAVFGTNSEANSMGVDEKKKLLDRSKALAVRAGRMTPEGALIMPTETRGVRPEAYRNANVAKRTHAVDVLMALPEYPEDLRGKVVRVLCGEVEIANLTVKVEGPPTCRKCKTRLRGRRGSR